MTMIDYGQVCDPRTGVGLELSGDCLRARYNGRMKNCKMSECPEKRFRRGYCTRHYRLASSRGIFIPKDQRTYPSTCRVPSCAESNDRRGLCTEHYFAWWESTKTRPCSRCKQPATRAGLCSPHYRRRDKLLRRYGMTIAEYELLYSSQNGKCSICEKWKDVLHVDHDHETGCVRGLLCGNCNRAIGLFEDSLDRLSSAISYLGASS